MVYFNKQTYSDLENIFLSLVTWKTRNGQNRMDYDHCVSYYNDMVDVFESLDKLKYHRSSTYKVHHQYGEFVYAYRRNYRTTWYACYDKRGTDVYINRIVSNYHTL